MKRILEEPEPEFNTNSVPNTKPKQETIDNLNKLNTLDIRMIGATPLVWLAKKPKYTIFTITMADIKKALALKKHTDPATKVLVDYYKYLNIFLWKEANKLAEHQLYNHKIVLKGKQPRFRPLYRMS